jgi:YidC/Oxa1 family membrane protein insertase
VLDFLYIAVSWVLLRWHNLFTLLGFSESSGWGWALSIVFLVITARVLLFRLFIKQVHYTRNMQRIQPKIKKLREKYKDDRAEMNRQMMALQQAEGFNPLSGCLPLVLQIPVFIGLYHVLRHIANSATLCKAGSQSDILTLYTFSRQETCDAARAKIFDAPLAASFHDSNAVITALGGDPTSTRIVLAILLVISAVATFATQLLVRATAVTQPEGTAATVQRLMLWVIPIGVLASGFLFNFPLGVLLYWFTNNLWTLGQQAYIVRFHPHEPEPVSQVGQLGKTLAPKPGQRPIRTSKATSRTGADLSAEDEPDDPGRGTGAGGSTADASASVARSVPRPGQRPNRPGGKRPPAKRATQAKKRR